MLTLLLLLADPSVTLRSFTPETADRLPGGKEVDAVYGDLILTLGTRPGHRGPVAVIAAAIPGRNANLTTREVGGCLIDLAAGVGRPDELTVYRPGRTSGGYTEAAVRVDRGQWQPVDFAAGQTNLTGGTIEIRVRDAGGAEAVYVADKSGLRVTASGTADMLRIDKSSDDYATVPEGRRGVAWTESPFWGVSYGLAATADGAPVPVAVERRRRGLVVGVPEGATRTLAVGLSRAHVQTALGQAALGQAASGPASAAGARQTVTVYDATGLAQVLPDRVPENPRDYWAVRVAQPSERGERIVAQFRMPIGGNESVPLPPGPCRITARACQMLPAVPIRLTIPEEMSGQRQGKPDGEPDSKPDGETEVGLRFSQQPGFVRLTILSEAGFGLPAKVAFERMDGPAVNFGPISAIDAIREVQYLSGETRTVPLVPGRYRLTISRGPEYDAAISREFEVKRDSQIQMTKTLARAYDTPGWISADFHSHSTPSGDNTSHQRGRVLNLVCEDIDFAPCTEHQRIDTYQTHIDALGLQPFIASATGMELTGSELPINHHNVFPLIHQPFLQDGGGPRTGEDPDVQVERLALWDDRSDKLIQQNHPDLRRLLEDRDNDNVPDEGFARAIGLIDAIEIHPVERVLQLFPNAPPPRPGLIKGWDDGRLDRWIDLVQTRPITGVINTDAHWNHHGSGWTRNWIAVPDDDPARCSTMDIVNATERGRVVMSNGPYLTMTARQRTERKDPVVGVGQTLVASDDPVEVTIEVRCADWLDIDRVGLLVDGQMTHVFLRDGDGDDGDDGDDGGGDGYEVERPLRFRKTITLDTPPQTLIAVCGHATQTLGVPAGGQAAVQNPSAITNPIYVTRGE